MPDDCVAGDRGGAGRKHLEGASNGTVVSLKQSAITAEIIESCRRGERDGFRALYDAYKDKVYSISLYYFRGDPAAAADATQQVFLKLLTNIAQFRGDADFTTWLYRLVANTCMDSARRAKARDTRIAKEVAPDTLASPESQEENLVRSQRARLVQEALATIPPAFRLALLLRYFEDLSYEEMARALRCSMGTVASRLNRGHKLLAERLEALRRS
jgi:RNA polymerase sigma-70 factor (ECF subfamily)